MSEIATETTGGGIDRVREDRGARSTALLVSLCRKCLSRSKAQGWKGTKGDDKAIEFFVGAWVALEETGNELHGPLSQWIAMVLCVRGMFEVRHVVHEADKRAGGQA